MKESIAKNKLKKSILRKEKAKEYKEALVQEKLAQLIKEKNRKRQSKNRSNLVSSYTGVSINKKFFNENSKLGSCLMSFFGISFTKVLLVCSCFGLTFSIKMKKVPLYKINGISSFIERNFTSERALKKIYKSSLLHNITVGNYKGLRYKQGLPTNGQRSHTNRKTAKRLFLSNNYYLSCKNLTVKV